MIKLGWTDSTNLVTVWIFGGTNMQLGRTDVIRVRAQRNLGETDYTNSVGPILVIDKQRVGQANSVGPIRSSRLDRNVTKRKQSVCIAISVGPIAHFD